MVNEEADLEPLTEEPPPEVDPAVYARYKLGQVITFYSYKGGVGRSMAVANVAALLSRDAVKVLVVDFDLEAPGLERYFKGVKRSAASSSRTRANTPGVIDLVHEQSLRWQDCLLSYEPFDGSTVDLISAGRLDPDYIERVRDTNWRALFVDEKAPLGNRLEKLRREWRKAYRFILIDSRTGITDIGGICTIQLPDVLVGVFTTNEQSMEGVADVLESVKASQSGYLKNVDRAPMIVVPLPARDESYAERELAARWRRELLVPRLRKVYEELLPTTVSVERAVQRLKIPYVARWSFGESLPVVEEVQGGGIVDPSGIGFAYELLTRFIKGGFKWQDIETDSIPRLEAENSRRELLARIEQLSTDAREKERQLAEEFAVMQRDAAARLRKLQVAGSSFLALCVAAALGVYGLSKFEESKRQDAGMQEARLNQLNALLNPSNYLADAAEWLQLLASIDFEKKSPDTSELGRLHDAVQGRRYPLAVLEDVAPVMALDFSGQSDLVALAYEHKLSLHDMRGRERGKWRDIEQQDPLRYVVFRDDNAPKVSTLLVVRGDASWATVACGGDSVCATTCTSPDVRGSYAGVAVSPSGGTFVVLDTTGTLQSYDWAPGQCPVAAKRTRFEDVRHMLFLNDSAVLVQGKAIATWDLNGEPREVDPARSVSEPPRPNEGRRGERRRTAVARGDYAFYVSSGSAQGGMVSGFGINAWLKGDQSKAASAFEEAFCALTPKGCPNFEKPPRDVWIRNLEAAPGLLVFTAKKSDWAEKSDQGKPSKGTGPEEEDKVEKRENNNESLPDSQAIIFAAKAGGHGVFRLDVDNAGSIALDSRGNWLGAWSERRSNVDLYSLDVHGREIPGLRREGAFESARPVAYVAFSGNGEFAATLSLPAPNSPSGEVRIWQTKRQNLSTFTTWQDFRTAVSKLTSYCLPAKRIREANGGELADAVKREVECRNAANTPKP